MDNGTAGTGPAQRAVWRRLFILEQCPYLLPPGIQKNVQALQHMLRHPLVYRSSKPKLDSLQKFYVPREKRVSFLWLGSPGLCEEGRP